MLVYYFAPQRRQIVVYARGGSAKCWLWMHNFVCTFLSTALRDETSGVLNFEGFLLIAHRKMVLCVFDWVVNFLQCYHNVGNNNFINAHSQPIFSRVWTYISQTIIKMFQFRIMKISYNQLAFKNHWVRYITFLLRKISVKLIAFNTTRFCYSSRESDYQIQLEKLPPKQHLAVETVVCNF